MHHLQTLNNFDFNEKHYLQIKNDAIDTATASSYANIYKWRKWKKFIYTLKLITVFFTLDTLVIYSLVKIGSETKLNVLTDLNMKHVSIKFDYESSHILYHP